MRRDGRRKTAKRKSYDADHQSRINSSSESAPIAHPEVNGVDAKANDEELIQNIPTGDSHSVREEMKKNIKTEKESSKTGEEETKQTTDSEEENPGESLQDENPVDKNCSKGKTSPEPVGSPDKEAIVLSQLEKEVSSSRNQDEEPPEEEERNRQKISTKAANEAALRLYSSFSHLAMQALLNVKQETQSDLQLPEKYMQNLLSSLNGGYFGLDEPSPDFGSDDPRDADSPLARMLRPPAELSPDTFAKQLRFNDMASMVVCRAGNGKNQSGVPDAGPGVLSKLTGSTTGGQGGGSGLHQFVTRYTIERPDDPNKAGIEICLAGDDPLDPIIEVECGGNKGLLYVAKLCQGSKGQSILFNDEWLTPNEFQFISGRETAKDWKRSIRHCGKSLKTLMTKGILQVHPPVCECDYCKGHGPATVEKIKKRSYGFAHDRQLSIPDTMRSGGSTTPSSNESTTPISTGIGDGPGITLHKPGREGGLSSIISQLHNKKASAGNDARTGSGEESLDLSVRATSGTSFVAMNGRKRLREDENKNSAERCGEIDDSYLPTKRRHSNEDDCVESYSALETDLSDANDRRKSPKSINSEPLCLSSQTSSKQKSSKDEFRRSISPSRNGRNSSEYNGTIKDSANPKRYPPASTPGSSIYSDLYKSARNFQTGSNYSEHAFLDAMKRAVANVTANAYPDKVQTPPSPPPSSRQLSSGSSSSTRRGFINLETTSRRFDIKSAHQHSTKEQPMVELTSRRYVNGGRFCDQYDYDRQRKAYDNTHDSHKAPVTVLHHRPNQFENPIASGHQQTVSSGSHQFFPMPPPFYHGPGPERKPIPNFGVDRYRYGGSSTRFERKSGKGKAGSRKLGSGERRSRMEGDTPMLDLHNHAIPMMSLTYSGKKNKSQNGVKNSDKNVSRGSERSQSAFDLEKRSMIDYRKVVSDDEASRKSEALRRHSSSAPPLPPSFADPAVNGSKFLDENNNEKVNKDLKDEVFRFGHVRAKSSSPSAIRSHPYRDRSRAPRSSSSADATRPDSIASYLQESSYDGNPSLLQEYEMLRWKEMCAAVDDMGCWSVDDVATFLRSIGCDQYEEVFRDKAIDGDALPLLMEHHLINNMGLKLGHALKIIARIHRRLGNHCILIRERLAASQPPNHRPLFMTNSFSGSSEQSTPAANLSDKSPPLAEKEEISAAE